MCTQHNKNEAQFLEPRWWCLTRSTGGGLDGMENTYSSSSSPPPPLPSLRRRWIALAAGVDACVLCGLECAPPPLSCQFRAAAKGAAQRHHFQFPHAGKKWGTISY